MIRNKKTALVFVASVAVSALVLILRGRQFNLAEALGGALGLMLVPFLVAYLAKWTCQLFKIKFEERTFNIIYSVGWTLLAVGNILA
jgi:hypothetical protein